MKNIIAALFLLLVAGVNLSAETLNVNEQNFQPIAAPKPAPVHQDYLNSVKITFLSWIRLAQISPL